ncbi:MAG: pre-peptidase C-terminal domain-containing protein [Anaerolineae bacterium]
MRTSTRLQGTFWGMLLLAGLLSLALGFVTGSGAALPVQAAQAAASSGPDLVIQSLRVIPPFPDVGQPADIEVRITNVGSASAGGFRTYLYVDPPASPEPNTPDTSLTFIFGLNAGQSFTWTYRGYTFNSPGCGHIIYAWVDRDNDVPEDNETNNLTSTSSCIGTTPTPTVPVSPTPSLTPTPTPTATPRSCTPDIYEPDQSCGAARPITTDGVHQMHSLCPVGDEDWVKFTATEGITYTLTTANVGADGDTILGLYNRCDQPPLSASDPAFGNGAELTFQAPTTGEYFLQVKHHLATYGPATDYELFVTAATSCSGDDYEPDDSCATARDITVGAAPQSHVFCKPADQDWVKFTATSGARYLISATGMGADADPILGLYNTCSFGAPLANGQTIEWTAPANGIYYVAAQNHDPTKTGETTRYNLSVVQSLCAADSFESDDSPVAASLAMPTGADQAHTSCPAGDQDWVRFPTTQGQRYVIETFELGADADTVLCLFGPDNTTQIACDDDGGGGLASRLRWTAPTTGVYYLRVKHNDPGVSGPTTSYHLAISEGEPLDAFEPDNSAAQARPITTDGSPQSHNFTPDGDSDWVRFDAVPGEPYVIQTSNLSGDCDTVLHLYDTDGVTELTTNDDYGVGPGSRITYIFPRAGTYYARVHHYRSNRSGRGTSYSLSVTRGAQPPSPTPTATPPATPVPTSTPPASGIRTLIVTNRERLEALYGAAAATDIMNSLALLASDPRVQGTIIQAETDNSALAAYTLWNATPLDTTRANNVAAAVRNRIMAALATNPSVEYVVIVGNDSVVPFRRTPDRTKFGESNYQTFVTANTSIWAACRDNMTLTDDYYVSREPKIVKGQEVYVPDYAIGRLPEGPTEITAFINGYLAQGPMTMHNVLVTGYDFVVDAGQTISNTIAADLGPSGTIDSSLIGPSWSATSFRQRQLNTTPRFDVQFINGHASQHLQGAPLSGGVPDTDVFSFGSSDLRSSLVVTLGCHSGLNETAALPTGLDLAQAFFKRGANYIANTGYGWGSNEGLGWSERLMNNYTRALVQGGNVAIGKAILTAKRRYFSETTTFDEYDEKAMMESTLYGLPQYQLVSGGLLSPEDPFPSVQVTQNLPLDVGPVHLGNVNISLPASLSALDEHHATDGVFYGINRSTTVEAGQPVQPKFYANVTSSSTGRVHGVVLHSGHYSDTATLDPLVSQPVHEYLAPRSLYWAEPPLQSDGWLPAQPATLQNLVSPAGETDMLVTQLGQYDAQGLRERLYDNLNLDLYYSDSPDWTGPTITYVGEQVDAGRQIAGIKVEGTDLSGILGGMVTYTQGAGQWDSVALAYDAARMKWVADIPATRNTLYYVQLVDRAGNVSAATNKGHYYSLPDASRYVFLPYLATRE